METLKKIFPYSFKEKADVAALVINILIHIGVSVAVSIVITILNLILGFIPLIGAVAVTLLGLLGSVVGLYLLIGIILTCLDYFKVLK